MIETLFTEGCTQGADNYHSIFIVLCYIQYKAFTLIGITKSAAQICGWTLSPVDDVAHKAFVA